jgi:hypothetical protein
LYKYGKGTDPIFKISISEKIFKLERDEAAFLE